MRYDSPNEPFSPARQGDRGSGSPSRSCRGRAGSQGAAIPVDAASRRTDLYERRRFIGGLGGLSRGPVSRHRDLIWPHHRAQRSFPGSFDDFRVIYGRWERLRPTISGSRGVGVGLKSSGWLRAPLSPGGWTGSPVALAVLEALDQEAEEGACNGRTTAVSGGALECFAGVRPAGLDHC